MKGPLAVVVILAAALTLATVAGAGPEATKQRVRIDLRIDQGGLVSGTFVLTPLKAGPIKRDWGRHYRRPTFPDGLWVFVGMRGNLVVRSRLKGFYTAGGSFAIGTWKVVDGSGQYAGVTGRGRSGLGSVGLSETPWAGRHEGFLALQ